MGWIHAFGIHLSIQSQLKTVCTHQQLIWGRLVLGAGIE
jgi:hypothetical protein